MSRYASEGSTGHGCKFHESPWGSYYRLTWFVDYYYSGSRLRYPRRFQRDTDEAGARRFCKKWGIPFPEPAKTPA